jgi:hypothetical protein
VADEILDLFGEPVRPDRGPGRPAVEWSVEKSNRVKVLFACGYEPKDVAPVLGCCLKTFRKVFSSECRDRRNAQLKLRSQMMLQLVEQAKSGNVGAIKALGAMIDREQVRSVGERVRERGKSQSAEPKGKPLGKKEAAREAAAAVKGKFGTRPPPNQLVN